ncbi:hypothetical protein Psi01_31560 [Planobispora siamensis]|uniref:Uncharacterized protein n=2 Tax=Planobispora siamensis TaxID=936338 RepID=A0A8J3SH81_9ACTN|nr:hypothetical protein Psi01_31560 [Planobispora siamensis]
MLGGAVAGAVTVVLSLLVVFLTESVGGSGSDPAYGTVHARDSAAEEGIGAGEAVVAVIGGIAVLVKLGVVGGLLGLFTGLVVALPVAPVMALAAPWLAVRPARARLVCACACAIATAALEAGIILVSGGWESSFFGNPLLLGPPLVIAAVVGHRYGPALVAPPAG